MKDQRELIERIQDKLTEKRKNYKAYNKFRELSWEEYAQETEVRISVKEAEQILSALTEQAGKEQPKEVKPTRSAKQILREVCDYLERDVMNDSDDITVNEAINAMEEYAAQSQPQSDAVEFGVWLLNSKINCLHKGVIPLYQEFLKSKEEKLLNINS